MLDSSKKLSVATLRRMLTGRGKMKMTNEEVDDLVRRITGDSSNSGGIECSAMVEQLMTENFTATSSS